MAKPEVQEDWSEDQVCVDDYPEHDYREMDVRDGIRTLECRRCGAESFDAEEA